MSDRKTEPFNFKVLNLKLIIKGETSTEKYSKLIEKWLNNSSKVKTGKDVFGKIKTFEKSIFESGLCYSGTIIRAKESEQTYEFDKDNNPIVVENNENHFTNPTTATFIFIPEAHRFALIENKGVNIEWFKSFIEKSFKPILEKDESIELSIKVGVDFIEEYIKNRPIRKIKIQMSYSNSDSFNSIAMKALEKNMRDTHTGKLIVTAESDKKGDIDVLENNILNPMAGLALDNGNIEVWDQENRTQKPSITTKSIPETYNIESTKYALVKDIYNKMINIFRSENQD